MLGVDSTEKLPLNSSLKFPVSPFLGIVLLLGGLSTTYATSSYATTRASGGTRIVLLNGGLPRSLSHH